MDGGSSRRSFPRPDGEVYVCGMADPAPLPDSPDAVQVSDEACAVLAQRRRPRVEPARRGAGHRGARPATGP